MAVVAAPVMIAMAVAAQAMQTASQIQAQKANAAAADIEAKQLEQSGKMEMAAERQRNTETLSKQRAIVAASGVGTTIGTPLENALNSAFEGEMNALRIGYGYEQKRQVAKFQRNYYRSTIPGIAIQGGLKMGSSILSSYMGGAFGGAASGAGESMSGMSFNRGG